MTPAKVAEVITIYESLLRVQWDSEPVRCSDATDLRSRLDHLRWMCGQVSAFVADGRMDKAFRWLGFLQGAFWALGIRSIEESKRDNAAEGEAFDKERV